MITYYVDVVSTVCLHLSEKRDRRASTNLGISMAMSWEEKKWRIEFVRTNQIVREFFQWAVPMRAPDYTLQTLGKTFMFRRSNDVGHRVAQRLRASATGANPIRGSEREFYAIFISLMCAPNSIVWYM